jgi:P-aminobenzoate N-oxygenase AurF
MGTAALDQEQGGDAGTDQGFRSLTTRLSRASVEKRFDAYADVDWDAAECALDPADPRLELPPSDPLGASDWYRAQPPELRSRITLYRVAAYMKVGWHFENLLQRGLLAMAVRLPNGAPEFRYIHHELIEESQHTLMFQEVVNRSGLPVRGMPRLLRRLAELLAIPAATYFPTAFFIGVIGGEDPIDHVQRQLLRDGIPHPLIERIMRIHVTEEARHLTFARQVLRRDVPRLRRGRRAVLSLVAPLELALLARLMLVPPGDMVRHCGIPPQVVRAAYGSPHGRRFLADAVAKSRQLCAELGLITPLSRALWRATGIWDRPAAERVA